MSEKFKIPETMEEALKRREEVLEQINKYNEEYFDGTTTLTDEEIALLQEEYQFLNELIEEEPVVEAQMDVEKNFFDKVNIFIWIYAVFALFSSFYMLQHVVGFSFLEQIIQIGDSQWVYDFPDWLVLIVILGSFLIYPSILVLIGGLLKLLVFKKTKEDKKAFLYIYLGQIALNVINFMVLWFLYVEKYYIQLKVY